MCDTLSHGYIQEIKEDAIVSEFMCPAWVHIGAFLSRLVSKNQEIKVIICHTRVNSEMPFMWIDNYYMHLDLGFYRRDFDWKSHNYLHKDRRYWCQHQFKSDPIWSVGRERAIDCIDAPFPKDRYHAGQRLGTKDRDNDEYGLVRSAQTFKVAWWYNNCYFQRITAWMSYICIIM